MADISLQGLEFAPSQVWGSIRMVPLIRKNVKGDLLLMKRSYKENATMVSLEGGLMDPGMKYFSFIPHALVLNWSDDGNPIVANGAQLRKTDGKRLDFACASVRILHRMAKREASNQLRFLPLHLAMEGFLSLFFSGPDIAWTEYSRYARSHGLGFRQEWSYSGKSIPGLEDALRIFEMHENQSGVLVFIAETLACAFVVPSPQDYRRLHTSLLEDFFGELVYMYGLLYKTTYPMHVELDDKKISSLIELRKAVESVRSEWQQFQGFMAEALLQRKLMTQVTYSAGPFTLRRFITDLNKSEENHIGEYILRDNGDLEYLKTYRLSAAQTRRAYLLKQLSEQNWNLNATAQAMQCSREELIARFESVGFGYLLHDHIREAALKKRK